MIIAAAKAEAFILKMAVSEFVDVCEKEIKSIYRSSFEFSRN